MRTVIKSYKALSVIPAITVQCSRAIRVVPTSVREPEIGHHGGVLELTPKFHAGSCTLLQNVEKPNSRCGSLRDTENTEVNRLVTIPPCCSRFFISARVTVSRCGSWCLLLQGVCVGVKIRIASITCLISYQCTFFTKGDHTLVVTRNNMKLRAASRLGH